MSVSDGTAKKEDFRRFLHLTLQPVGKHHRRSNRRLPLDVPDLAFDFSGIGAADLAAKGRVFGQLVSNGVSIADAAEVSGLPISDTAPVPPGASNDA